MTILDRFSLAGKSVVVTGGTGLYGRPFSKALAEAGAHVIVTSRSEQTAAEGAAALRSEGVQASGMTVDLTDPGDISRFAEELEARHGAVDVLVNNAVHRAGRGLDETSADDWDATSAVNSRGMFLLTQAVSRGMVTRGSGTIINIGSIYGLVAPDFSIYEGTGMTMPLFYAYDKAGMIGFTRYLAAALGPKGVTVNCVCPGGLRSEGQAPEFIAAYEARVPLGRLATEDDVVGALVFLASDAAAYVNGAVLAVDGGWSVR